MLYLEKDLTTLNPPVIIAHGVNCSNVMGKGVAKALYKKWPSVKDYYHKFDNKKLGEVQFIEVEPKLIVANCFTQEYFGNKGKYANPAAIESALKKCAAYALDNLDIKTVHMPKIGCGLGGLNWTNDLLPIIIDIEKTYSLYFTVCSVLIC